MLHKNLPILITGPKHCSASILSLRFISAFQVTQSKQLRRSPEVHHSSVPWCSAAACGEGQDASAAARVLLRQDKTEARFSLEKSLSQTPPLSLLGQSFALAFASTKECRLSSHFCICHNKTLSHKTQYPLLREGEQEGTNHGIYLAQ